FLVVPPARTDFADHVHIGQKIHFNPPLPFALAPFAPSPCHVERKASRFVPALTRLRQHGIEIADVRKHPGISCGVRSRSASDGRLISRADVIYALKPANRLMFTCRLT